MSAPVPLGEQIACVLREIRMRRSVYPRWISSGRISPDKAAAEIAAMVAVLDTLRALPDAPPTQPPLL